MSKYVVLDDNGIKYSTIGGQVITIIKGASIDQKIIDNGEIKEGTILALLEDGRIEDSDKEKKGGKNLLISS